MTGIGALPRMTSAAYPQVAVSRASPSRSVRTRRKVRSLGTTYRPCSGLNRAPRRCRTSCGVRAAHCRIAVTQSLPATNVAHAVRTRITSSGCRNPRSRRGSGTSRNRCTSDDATDNGSTAPGPAASSASHNARSARWPTTGSIREDDDTSATPGTIFRTRHPKDHQSRARPTTPTSVRSSTRTEHFKPKQRRGRACKCSFQHLCVQSASEASAGSKCRWEESSTRAPVMMT